MALLKFLKGNASALPSTSKEGYIYVTQDSRDMYIFKTDNERIQLNSNYANALRKNNSVTNELLFTGSDDASVYFSNGIPKIATNMINHGDLDTLLRGNDIGQQDFDVESDGNIPDADLVYYTMYGHNVIIEFTFDTGEKKAYLTKVYYNYDYVDDQTAYNQILIRNNYFSILIECYEYIDEEGYVSGEMFIGTVRSSLSNKISSFRIYEIDATKYIQNAATYQYGITKLSDSINSTSTSMAATPSAVKKAYDLANTANTTANTANTTANTANTTASAALPKAGGTMTGQLILQSNVYTDDPSYGALNLSNSNIIGVNGIYMADESGDASEGINFVRTSTTADTLWAKGGVLYFTPNRTYGSSATNNTVIHSGNKNLITPADIGAVPIGANKYTFVNKNLNTVNIDNDYDYNYITAISDFSGAYGTLPPYDGWCTVVNYYNYHFANQVAYTCESSTNSNRTSRMWIRERYVATDYAWSDWHEVYTTANKPTTSISKTLTWTANTAQNTYSVPEITASSNGFISLAHGIDSETTLEMIQDAKIVISSQTDGSITLKALGKTPTSNFNLILMILG